jgi:hypothetical protein
MINSSNGLNMPTVTRIIPKTEIVETFSTLQQFDKDCLNSENLSFWSFEAEQVDPVTNHTYWMRKNLTAYGFYQIHVIEPVWFDAEALTLYLKNTESDDSREVFTRLITHYPTEGLWNCKPNATYEYQERDAAGNQCDGNSGSTSRDGLYHGGFMVKPFLQVQ